MRKLDNNINEYSSEINNLKEDVKYIIGEFGALVKKERNKQEMKIQELSAKSGVSVGVISDLENQKKEKIPNLYTLVALARTLKIGNNYFVRLIFGNIAHEEPKEKTPDQILTEALVAYGVPSDVAANILVGIELSYGKHTKKK